MNGPGRYIIIILFGRDRQRFWIAVYRVVILIVISTVVEHHAVIKTRFPNGYRARVYRDISVSAGISILDTRRPAWYKPSDVWQNYVDRGRAYGVRSGVLIGRELNILMTCGYTYGIIILLWTYFSPIMISLGLRRVDIKYNNIVLTFFRSLAGRRWSAQDCWRDLTKTV